MKLKNKKTGEIIERYIIETASAIGAGLILQDNDTNKHYQYTSLAELNAEWCDAPEEPFSKDFYIIFDGEVKHCIWYRERVAACPDDAHAYLGEYGREQIDNLKSVGLYFETREEAELAVRKLKAWKRLKDKGFKIDLWDYDGGNYQERITTGRILFRVKDYGRIEENDKDLDFLFGGEE